MRVYRRLGIRGSKAVVEGNALFDTGASFTVIRRSIAERVGSILTTGLREFTLADGKTKLKVEGYVPISTILEGSPIDDIAYVVEDLAEELIIGAKVMEFYDIKVDPANNRVIVGKNYTSAELYSIS